MILSRELTSSFKERVFSCAGGLLEIICTSTLFLKGKKRSCRLKSIAICKLIYKCIYKNAYLIKVCIHFLNPTFGQNHILKIKLYAVVNANLASSQFFRFKIKICIYEFLRIFAQIHTGVRAYGNNRNFNGYLPSPYRTMLVVIQYLLVVIQQFSVNYYCIAISQLLPFYWQ